VLERRLLDLGPGDRACLTVYVQERRRSATRDNIPYAELLVCDRSGRLKAHKWDLKEDEWAVLSTARFLSVVARARVPKGARPGQAVSLSIESFHEAPDVSERDFLPEPRGDTSEHWGRLSALVRRVSDADLVRLLQALFGDKAFRRDYCLAPAAQHRHHPYPGGLVEHSVEVAELCLAVCDRVGHLNCDILIAGALLHDVGKLREMRCDLPGYEFTADGGLLGHVSLGADLVREAIADLEGFSEDVRQRLLHLILSHHGRKEWGAPVEPATPEALLLHTCDQISVQMFYCREAHRTAGNDAFVWVPALERRLYLGQRNACDEAGVPEQTGPLQAPEMRDLPGAGLSDDAPVSDNPFTDEVFNIGYPDRPALRIVPGGAQEADILPEMVALPIYGCIAAGTAIRSEQNLEGFRAVLLEGRRETEDFFLRVSGDSMRDAHILDGDLVRVRPGPEAREGDIVAALLDGDVTVKRFHRNEDGILLRAENPAHPDIPVRDAEAFDIQGIVVGLVRERIA